MLSIATTAALCLSLALAPASAPPPADAPVAAAPSVAVEASLMVEVPTDQPHDVALRTRMFDAAGRVMAAMSVTQRARLDLPGIVITLHRPRDSSAVTSYSIVIRHTLLGDTPLATIGAVCRDHDDACIEQIGADLALLLPRLRGYIAAAPPAPPPSTAVSPPPPLASPPAATPALPPNSRAPTPRKPLHSLARAGIGVLAAGVAGLGVGIGLAANPPRLNPENYDYLITTRPVGYAILGTSLAVMTAGTAMLIVGVRRSTRVVPVAQTFGGRSLGLGISGRF